MFQAGAVGANGRVPELLEKLKAEYEKMSHETNLFKAQRDEYERKLEVQVSELSLFQSSLAELQRTHLTIKQSHEEEIMRLRRQLESSGIKPEPVKANLLSMPSAITTQGLPSLSSLTGDLSSQLAAALQSHPGLGGEAGGVRADTIFTGMAAGMPGLGGMSVGLGVPHNFANVAETVRPLDGSTGKPLDDWNVVHNPSATAKTIVELQHTLEHDSVVCCVRFSNNGKYVATGCNKTAVLYDAETGQKLAILSNDGIVETQAALEQLSGGGDSYVRSVCFSPDSKILVAGAEDKKIKIWDIEAKRLRHSLQGHTKDIYSVDFSSDSRHVVSGSGDRRAKMWNVVTGECTRTFGDDDGPKDGVTSVAMSPDCRYVAAGSLDRAVRLWDAESGVLLERFDGHSDSVYSVSFSPDGKLLASGSLDKTLKLWDLSSVGTKPAAGGGKCKHTCEGHKDFVLSVVFAPHENWLISGSKDRSVQFWDPKGLVCGSSDGPVLILQGHQNSVISVAHSPAGKVFATGSGDKRARIWKYSSVDR